ncbi:MAG: acetyl-CoA carboxylase carboxyltransferase subunit alpha [Alphaproteobacteria bacterium]|nr:acetyl-CoA carboxylase carboxyltransferase subunit alpha [Alphaproteobacteria bacterium]
MHFYLDFEKPIAELEGKVVELRRLAAEDPSMDIADEVKRLEAKAAQLLSDTYGKLTPWQKTLVARHPNRPHFFDFVDRLIVDFTPMAGDRVYGEDAAIIGGLGRFRGRSVMVIGHEKGRDTKTRLQHNFGMAMPEGYRKAVRLMSFAERFGLPVLTLVDTPGAYPGIGAEERGQAEAIARSTERCLTLNVPVISVIIGEGMSGGAIGIAAGDDVMMLEHAVYAVISPEACSSILWHSAEKAQEAAAAMKITAQDLLSLQVVNRIITEPVGGAHRDPATVIDATGNEIANVLDGLLKLSPDHLKRRRRERYLAIGRTVPAG